MSRYCTVRAAAMSPAPSARHRTMAIQTGRAGSCHCGDDAVKRLQHEQTPSATAKSSSVDERPRERQDQPRKVHLADEVRIADERQARLVQRHAEQVPHQQAREREQKVGRPARPRAGDDAEREVQHAGGDDRLQHDPRDAERCLAIPQLDVAARELDDQILEVHQLVQIDRHPARRRAERADGDGFRDAHLTHFRECFVDGNERVAEPGAAEQPKRGLAPLAPSAARRAGSPASSRRRSASSALLPGS